MSTEPVSIPPLPRGPDPVARVNPSRRKGREKEEEKEREAEREFDELVDDRPPRGGGADGDGEADAGDRNADAEKGRDEGERRPGKNPRRGKRLDLTI